MIPGAEHAPTIAVGYVTERGGFYTSIEDIPKIRRVDTGEFIPDAYIEARRQLTVTDPDDQRVIWRLAALQLGATEAQAEVAVILRAERDWWVLRPATYQSKAFYLARVHAPDLAHATAALCAAVWGPA